MTEEINKEKKKNQRKRGRPKGSKNKKKNNNNIKHQNTLSTLENCNIKKNFIIIKEINYNDPLFNITIPSCYERSKRWKVFLEDNFYNNWLKNRNFKFLIAGETDQGIFIIVEFFEFVRRNFIFNLFNNILGCESISHKLSKFNEELFQSFTNIIPFFISNNNLKCPNFAYDFWKTIKERKLTIEKLSIVFSSEFDEFVNLINWF